MPRLLAITTPENIRSRHLLEQLGMQLEQRYRVKPEDDELCLYAMALATLIEHGLAGGRCGGRCAAAPPCCTGRPGAGGQARAPPQARFFSTSPAASRQVWTRRTQAPGLFANDLATCPESFIGALQPIPATDTNLTTAAPDLSRLAAARCADRIPDARFSMGSGAHEG